jgi:hypothetical protein
MNRLSFYILAIALWCNIPVAAQGLKVMPGTTLKFSGGNYDLVLSDGAHLENNANIQSNNLVIVASGMGGNQIKGSGALSVGQILMNKTAGQILQLQKNINVANNVTFTGGLLDLNGFNLILADTALLLNESETSRIVGANGGSVQIQQHLNAPLAENPGNLGLVITSGADWGNTLISRSHNVFTNAGGSSIARNFKVQPTNNTGLNAFLRMYYKDAELNGLDESILDFFHSVNNGLQWTNIGSVSRNVSQNFVNFNGIQSVALLTLSTTNNPLPLTLTDITANCNHNNPVLQWRITNPKTTSFFRVKKSGDGIDFITAAEHIDVNADEHYWYTFTDIPSSYSFYRLESLGIDGQVYYSPVQTVNCKDGNYVFRILQNPVVNVLQISIASQFNMDAGIQIFDLQGRLILSQPVRITPGLVTVSIDPGNLAKGMYQLRVSGRQELLWQTKFVKQ